MISSHQQQSGFTLVEVLIATSIFSIALLLISASFIEISSMYRRGISLRRVQQSSRLITDDLNRLARPAQSIVYSEEQVAGGTVKKVLFDSTDTANKSAICAYDGSGFSSDASYDIRKFQNPTGGCSLFDGTQEFGDGESLLEPGTEFLEFETLIINQGSSASINITLGPNNSRVNYASGGNADLIDSSTNTCNLQSSGRQFCAVLDFETVITVRGGE